MRHTLFAIALLAGASTAAAQTPPALPTSVNILVIPSTGDPATVAPVPNGTTTLAIGPSSPNCNLAPLAAPSCAALPPNPSIYRWNDPYHAGQECSATIPANLAAGTYRVTSTYGGTCDGVACTSARGALAPCPFSVTPAPTPAPAPPTGGKVLP